MSKIGLAGSALLATAGGATTLASGLTITAHASEKPQTNTQQPNQADKLKEASNQLDTASKQQAKMINALLESKVDAQVPTQPGTYTKSVALLDASGKQLGTATLTRVVNADGSTQSSLSKDIPAGYTLKDVNVLNHYPSAVTLTRVAGATQAGTTTKAIKLTDASGKLIATGTVTRVVDEKGASTVSVKGIPQGYGVANMYSLSTFPDQLVIEKGEAINSSTAEKTDTGTMNNVPAGGTTTDSKKILDSGGVTKTAGQGNATAGNQSSTTTNTGADKGNTANTGNSTAGQGNQQAGNTTSGTTTGNNGSQNGQAQQGGTTTDNGTSATDSATNAQGVPVSDAVKDALAHHIAISDGVATPTPEKPVEKPVTMVNTANATNSNQANTTDSNTNTGADANKGQQTSDSSKDSSKTSTDSKTTTDQSKTDTKKDDSKTSTSTTDSAKKDDTKKDDSKASTSKNTSASTDEKKDEAKKGDSKSDTSKTNASKTTDNSKTNDTNSKVDNAIKGIDSVAKGSTDATKSADSKSSDTDKKNDSKKSDNKKSDDKKSDKKDGKLDLSDTTDALKKSSKDDDKKDSNSDNSSKKDNVSNLLNKSANKSSKASDNAKVADADVSDNLSGKDDSTKKGTTSSSTNATLPETGNTQSTAGILAGSAMVATMTALGIGASRRKRV